MPCPTKRKDRKIESGEHNEEDKRKGGIEEWGRANPVHVCVTWI